MEEYVSKEAVIERLRDVYEYEHPTASGEFHEFVCYEMPQTIRNLSAADVKPVVRGEWISVPHKRARICFHCECDEPSKFAENDADVYNFCPNCGADMRPRKKLGVGAEYTDADTIMPTT